MSVDVGESPDLKRQVTCEIGERVHTLMWRGGRTQKQLAAVLQIGQPAVSDRLRGKTEWSAVDIAITAAWLGVAAEDLMPEVELIPGGGDDGGASAGGAPTRARTWDLRIISPQIAA